MGLAGLATGAVGTGLSMSAASQARKDMERAVQAQLQKQEQFQKMATPVFEESLDASTAEKASRDMNAGRRGAESLYGKLADLPVASMSTPLPSDSATRAQIGQQQNTDAQLQGFSDYAFRQWLNNQQANNQLGVISQLSGASARNAPLLAQLAGQRSAGMAGLGSLLSTGGTLASIYGATRIPGSGALASTTPPPGTITTPWGSMRGGG